MTFGFHKDPASTVPEQVRSYLESRASLTLSPADPNPDWPDQPAHAPAPPPEPPPPCPSENPTSTPRSGRAATSCAAAWTRRSTKDYVLTLLFMKYVSDKYAGSGDFADITVPPGGSFADMVDLKGTKEIGDGINKVIGRLADANDYLLKGVIDQADFNDESKLGKEQGDAGPPLEAGRDLRGARLPRQPRPRRTTSWATRTSTSCGTSRPSRARARGSSTPRRKSPASWPA